MAIRFDKATLKPAIKAPDGRVRLDAFVTRTGVFSYMLPDGETRREYRPAREVFDDASLETFATVPVTNDHPPEMVNAQNARQYTVGLTGEQARADGEFVRLPMTVFDAEAIAAMENGKVQVSVGYACDLELVQGTAPNGERYDAIQRNIRVNHVALVDEGRAGPSVRVRLDAAQMVLEDEKPEPENLTKETDRPDAQNQAITDDPKGSTMTEEEMKAKIAELELALKEAQDKLAGLQGERDALQSQADTADKERNDALLNIEPRVRARVALVQQVTPYVEGDLSKFSDRALKVAAVKKLDGIDIPQSDSDAYVNGYFAAAITRADAASKAADKVRTDAAGATVETDKPNPRDAMLARNAALFAKKGN